MRDQTRILIEELFTQNDYTNFEFFSSIIEDHPRDSTLHRHIWIFDQSLGGFGGYSSPLDPTCNPFNQLGKYRNVFRSLQYARSDMYLGFRPRHIIEDSGLHIESLVKILLEKTSKVDSILNRNLFGKNIEALVKHQAINSAEAKVLVSLKSILNVAKHDTDENETFTFNTLDSVVFYFCCRKIGNLLLAKIGHETVGNFYQIQF